MGTMHIKKKTTHGYIILEFERFIELFVYAALDASQALSLVLTEYAHK